MEGKPFSPLVEHAIEFAAEWHAATHRKSRWREQAFTVPDGEVLRVPAMAHVTAVAMIVQRAGWDDATVAAAFLHDTLEDPNRWGCYLPADTLRLAMGDEVVDLVLAVTEQKFDADGSRRSWRARKEGYVATLRSAPAGAVAVSLADKLHNLWTMNEALLCGVDIFTTGEGRSALTAGPEEQIWFVRAVLEVSLGYTDRRLVPLRDQLGVEIQRFAECAKID